MAFNPKKYRPGRDVLNGGLCPSPGTLDVIGRAQHTDKSSLYHNYLPLYEQIMLPCYHSIRRLLEIGVQGGCSLRMWRDYLPYAYCYGVDKDPECKDVDDAELVPFDVNGDAFQTWNDANCEKHGQWDIIIDDGSHRAEETIPTFHHLWHYLRPGGWYVIEDIHTDYEAQQWPTKHGVLRSWLETLIDSQNLDGATDHGDWRLCPKWNDGRLKTPRFTNYLIGEQLAEIRLHKSIVFIKKALDAE